jgi:hypothetical protein
MARVRRGKRLPVLPFLPGRLTAVGGEFQFVACESGGWPALVVAAVRQWRFVVAVHERAVEPATKQPAPLLGALVFSGLQGRRASRQ